MNSGWLQILGAFMKVAGAICLAGGAAFFFVCIGRDAELKGPLLEKKTIGDYFAASMDSQFQAEYFKRLIRPILLMLTLLAAGALLLRFAP